MSEIEATFGFVDLAGFTALTEAHGDNEAVALLDRFEAITTAALGPADRQVARAEAAGRLRQRDRDHWFCSLGCAAAFAADPERYTARRS